MSALLPFGRQTVGSLLVERAAATPHAPFLTFDDGDATFDYADTVRLAERGAAVLAGAGVGRGDRVALVLDNRPEFLACWFGAAMIGAVIVPTGPQTSAEELRHIVGHARCRVVVCTPDLGGLVTTDDVVLVTTGSDFDTRAAAPAPPADPAVSPLDPLAILYTSGTTSRPKGVVVTHANYLVAGEVVAGRLRMRPDDRWLVVLPLFHANAQYYCVMSAMVTGASVAVAHRFSASGWPLQARRHRASLASLFAAPIRMILAQPPRPDDAGNRLRATLFAQNLTADQLAAFEERFGCPLVQIYGMTETVAPPLMNALYGRRDNMTIGRPSLPTGVRIVSDELWVPGRPGVTLMSGYLDDQAATDAALRDGWLRTGDVIGLQPDGLIAFRDRAKDMIKRSGENVAAAEVERVVNEHPLVFESAAVGVPDPIRDEAIKVYVVLEPGAELGEGELIAFCAARLTSFKVPGQIRFIDALPRTSVGKVRKHLLKTIDDT
ncbi:AMP-binding protein [Nonomuraea sp. NPDC005983]|uniref:AMP-binding protein n=1 Tax=Nonomuraea sp. NPDC005983 TaxID=3155595 RepID=UPI0033A381BB